MEPVPTHNTGLVHAKKRPNGVASGPTAAKRLRERDVFDSSDDDGGDDKKRTGNGTSTLERQWKYSYEELLEDPDAEERRIDAVNSMTFWAQAATVMAMYNGNIPQPAPKDPSDPSLVRSVSAWVELAVALLARIHAAFRPNPYSAVPEGTVKPLECGELRRASHESALLIPMGSYTSPLAPHLIIDIPGCARGKNCVGVSEDFAAEPGSGVDATQTHFRLAAYMTEDEWRTLQLTGQRPSVVRCCALCERRIVSLVVTGLLSQCHVLPPGIASNTAYVLMDREDGYKREYCFTADSAPGTGIVAPYPMFMQNLYRWVSDSRFRVRLCQRRQVYASPTNCNGDTAGATPVPPRAASRLPAAPRKNGLPRPVPAPPSAVPKPNPQSAPKPALVTAPPPPPPHPKPVDPWSICMTAPSPPLPPPRQVDPWSICMTSPPPAPPQVQTDPWSICMP